MTNEKIHPYKFSMWIGIVSMTMLFAGLTSAYIVRSSQAHWANIQVPKLFIISTFFILLSSFTLHLSIKDFKQRQLQRYSVFLFTSIGLGLLFMFSQCCAFYKMIHEGILLSGNVAGSFIYIIVGIHLLHVLGGIITLIWVYCKQRMKKKIVYSPVALEVAALYWHFVDILWIYLVVFYCVMLH